VDPTQVPLSDTETVLIGLAVSAVVLPTGLFGRPRPLPLAGFLIFLVLKHTSQTAQVLAVYVITWLLLLSGVRAVVVIGARWMLQPAVQAPVR
jgi:hypothetical protein